MRVLSLVVLTSMLFAALSGRLGLALAQDATPVPSALVEQPA